MGVGGTLSESSLCYLFKSISSPQCCLEIHQSIANGSERIESIGHNTLPSRQVMSRIHHSNSSAGPSLPECP